MNKERSRIEADLGGVVDGEVLCDDTFLQMYASDASIYELRPLAVVRPNSSEDVIQCVNYSRENQIPLFPRGSASNVFGGSIGPGIVLDFSTSMRRVISVERESITVQPGMVLANLNLELNSHGRRFGPDPLTRRMSTVGGVLAQNSCGSKWLKYGTPRDCVLSLKVVLSGGEEVVLHTADDTTVTADAAPESSQLNRIQKRMAEILSRHGQQIEERQPKTKINQAGYNLFDLHVGDKIDLTRLLVGSEGTLGIVTEAKLKTQPHPRNQGVAILFFQKMEAAAVAAVEIGKMPVVACDLLDRRLMTMACESNHEYKRMIPSDAEAMLLVEVQADDYATLQTQLNHLTHRIQRRKKLAFDVRTATHEDDRKLFWRLTRRVIPTLYRLRGKKRPLTFIDDIAIDPVKLPEFMKAIYQILNENEVTASVFSHTPQGVVNIRPFLDLSNQEDLQTMTRLADQLFDKVISLGGSISGSSGDGLSRSAYLRKQYGAVYDVFKQVKFAFDPQNIFNPGKIIRSSARDMTDNVRRVQPIATIESREGAAKKDSAELTVLQPQLNWSVDEIAHAARNCNGCGRCRSSLPEERMCPIFRLAPREEASPRSKANLMRGITTGQLSPATMTSEEFKMVADLCVNCHQCRKDCPAQVDIPKLMVEAKAQYVAVNGLKFSDWLLTRLDWLYSIAGQMPRLTNVMIRTPTVRMLLDRFFGIARGRKLPPFSTQTFLRWAARNDLSRTTKQKLRKVCYFVDAYANYNDDELGRAFVNVLSHNGIEVVVPQGQVVSGMSLISDGALARARKLASKNVELLADYVRQGYTIVTTEPSAALALKHEYLNILDEDDARLVADSVVDSCSLLWELQSQGDLQLDFRPVNQLVGYHVPCHMRVLTDDPPAAKLLDLIPGMQVERIEKGCSGMAGTWGLKSKNYLRSLRMGLALINEIRQPAIIAGTTECSTCKIQMEQGTVKPTIHPIKILAYAYGIMPELDDLFSRRSEELATT